MESLSQPVIADIFYNWGRGMEGEKSRLWERYPQCREMFVRVEHDPFSLVKTLKRSQWPELVKLRKDILNGGFYHVKIITKVLQVLSPEDAVEAFYNIVESLTRERVIGGLTPESKERVDAALTQAAIQQLEQVPGGPEENYFLMTKGFLPALVASARTCGSKRCISNNKPYSDYAPFRIGRCLRHSFHLACFETENQHACNYEANAMMTGYDEPEQERQEYHDLLWRRIFKTNSWLKKAVEKGYHPVLISAHLDDESNPWMILFVWDISGDLRYDFESSLHNYQKSGDREYVFGSLTVRVCGLDSESEVIKDYTKLFTEHEERRGITTKYCFWEDPARGVQSVEPEDVVGIDGKITGLRDVAPIAAINLYPYTDKQPIQIRIMADKDIPVVLIKEEPSKKDLYGGNLPSGWRFKEEYCRRDRYLIRNWGLVGKAGFHEARRLGALARR